MKKHFKVMNGMKLIKRELGKLKEWRPSKENK